MISLLGCLLYLNFVKESIINRNPKLALVESKSDDLTLAVLAHVLGLFVGFLGPLIILLVSKSKPVKEHARNALNWQISVMIYCVVSVILLFVLVGFLLLISVYIANFIVLVGFLLLVALCIANFIFCIIAAVKAGNGETWKYPLSIPFLKG